MPFKSDGKIRKCKYCDNLAKINYNGIKRRHKGYYRTCGSDECLKKQYLDKAVNQKKSYISRQIKCKCDHCGREFIKEMFKQKWCKDCVPSKAARAIISRYDISYPEYLEMLNMNKNCPICLRKLDNPVIDHDHKTGKIRGRFVIIVTSHLI
jgi:hypothetical protein